MMRKQKHLYSHLCRLVVSLLLPFTLQAQSLPTTGSPGEVVGSGLTVYNSIVWDNVFENATYSDNYHNLVNKDPLFASATDFFLQSGSPAIGKGDKSVNDLNFDIAGVIRTDKINIGAYENEVKYIIIIKAPQTQEGTLSVYEGITLIPDGTEVIAGTELRISAIPAEGYRLEKLTANGGPIINGDTYILTTETTFEAEIKQGNGRPLAYTTAKSGSSKFNVYNNIIYNNADEYGTYSLDKTNVIADPKFISDTEFNLQPASPAIGNGDASKLPAGSSDIAGVNIAESGAINAGVYQNADCTLSWITTDPTDGGTLEVFYLVENETRQKVRVAAINNGGGYPATTVVVKVNPAIGYILQEIKANDKVLTVAKGEASFYLNVNTVITATFRSFEGTGAYATVYQPDGATLRFRNNIVYGNIKVTDIEGNPFYKSTPVAANVAEEYNHLDGEDPLFYRATDFRVKTGSPVIDKGDNNAITATTDLAGNDRLYNGETVDLGAYETKEGVTYMVTFDWTDLKDKNGKAYAIITVTADGKEIATSDRVAAGSEIRIDCQMQNEEKYERSGLIALTGVATDYLPAGVTTFTLEEDTHISVPIRLRRHLVTYEVANGSIKVNNKTTLIQSGQEVGHEVILTVQVTPDDYYKAALVAVNGQQIEGAEDAGGYIVTVREATSILVSCVPAYELKEDGTPKLKDPSGDPKNPDNWETAAPKGLVVWDVQDATVTASAITKGGQTIPVVSSNDLLEPGTVVTVKVKPDNAKYLLTQFEVNGTDMTPTKKASSFEVTIPDADAKGKVKPTYIVIRYGENTNPGPGPGPSDPVTNYTLTVKALPDGITMDPQPGIYTVAQGSSRLFRITVDPEIAANYVYLMVNDEAALIHDPAEPKAFYTHLLIDIYRDTEVSVIVREDPDPNTDPTGNAQVQNDSRIWTGSGMVFIETAKPDRVFIYTMQGRLYTEQRIAAGETMIQLPAGVYIVVLPENRKTEKVMVGY